MHSLLRVRDLSSRMMEMFDTSGAKEDEKEIGQRKDESDSNQGGEDVGEQRSVP